MLLINTLKLRVCHKYGGTDVFFIYLVRTTYYIHVCI